MSKIRLDFVTNSSSSSYLVVYKINDFKEFRDYIKDEYGKCGLRLFENEMTTLENMDKYYKEQFINSLDDPDNFDKNTILVAGNCYTYTTEEDQDSEVILLTQQLPKQFKELLYRGESN